MKSFVPVFALAAAVIAAGQTAPGDWRSQGIIYLDHSLNVRLHTVPIEAVHMPDGFWSSRRRVATEHSLPSLLLELEAHGVVDNYRRLEGSSDIPRKGRPASDADLYQWIEGASWALASNEATAEQKTQLRGDIESLVSHIVAVQDSSGYLDTYFSGDKTRLRFTDLAHSYEDFCLGHLLQAGIAYYRATGKRRLLDVGVRFANLVVDTFGPGKRPFFTGYPELEMALVELYRTSGDPRYLSFVRYIFTAPDHDRFKLKESEAHFLFSGRPFTSHTEFDGHAVRALYAASGATDYYMESGDPTYRRTLDLLWTDLTRRKMYITGAVGVHAAGESFGDAYELPSQPAYADTCASIANVIWNFRLLAMTGDARYTDLLERTLYNAANGGMSLGGSQFCYRNPLASPAERRTPLYEAPCCPPNLERLFESLPGYLYATSRDGIYINLYENSRLDWHLEDGSAITVQQRTGYPWTGSVQVAVQPAKADDFTVYVRWPGWAHSIRVSVNGVAVNTGGSKPGSYVPLPRHWAPGDTISIEMPMPPVPIVANPRVADDYGRLAMMRGPLVYALEQVDQNGAALGDIFIRRSSTITIEPRKDLLNGVTLLKVPGQVAEESLGEEELYQPLASTANRARRPLLLTFVPYYAIGNREPTPMEVWVPMVRSDASGAALPSVAARHAAAAR